MVKLKEVTKKCEICGKDVKCAEFLFERSKPSEMCLVINDNGIEHIKIKRKEIYNNISQEKRQAFLDLFFKGKSIGESYTEAGLTQEEGFAIIDSNIEKTLYLRSEAKERAD